MALKNKYFDPQNFYYKVIAICILIGVDIILNSFTQFFAFGSKNAVNQYQMVGYNKPSGDLDFVLLAIQFVVQLLIIFTLLSIFSQTFFFKYGFLRITCSNFKFTFLFLFIYPIIYLIERVIRVIYVSDELNFENNELTVWEKPFYIVFYVIKYIFAFLFYIVSISTSYELGKSKYYKPDPTFGFKMNL